MDFAVLFLLCHSTIFVLANSKNFTGWAVLFLLCHMMNFHAWLTLAQLYRPLQALLQITIRLSRKRLSELSLKLAAVWLVLCVLGMSVKCPADTDKSPHGQFHNRLCFGWSHYYVSRLITMCISFLGPCLMFLTNVITSQFLMRSAREGEGESILKDLLVSCHSFLHFNGCLDTCTLFLVIDFGCLSP